MKRMVNENLIAILKEMESKGISIGDLADVLSHLSTDEDDNLVIEDGKLENDLDVNTNQLNGVSQINFSDNSTMDTAPHLYEHNITLQISVSGDTKTDIYGHLTILNDSETEFTLSRVRSYIAENFEGGSDYNKLFIASGDKNYTGINYDEDYYVQYEDSLAEISSMTLYSDCVIQIF